MARATDRSSGRLAGAPATSGVSASTAAGLAAERLARSADGRDSADGDRLAPSRRGRGSAAGQARVAARRLTDAAQRDAAIEQCDADR